MPSAMSLPVSHPMSRTVRVTPAWRHVARAECIITSLVAPHVAHGVSLVVAPWGLLQASSWRVAEPIEQHLRLGVWFVPINSCLVRPN